MNDAQLWSWIVTIVGVIGWYFVGKKYWWAWFIGLGAQVLWTIYATISQQPAFYISVILYTTIYGKNLWSWWKEHREKKAREDDLAKLFRQPGVLLPKDGQYTVFTPDEYRSTLLPLSGPISQPFGAFNPDWREGDHLVFRDADGKPFGDNRYGTIVLPEDEKPDNRRLRWADGTLVDEEEMRRYFNE